MNNYYFLIIFICSITLLLNMYITTYRWNVNVVPSSTLKIHACLRTRNSIKYLDEFISFHTKQGITSFDVYDDSESPSYNFFKKWDNINYNYVGNIKIKNENHFIWECMANSIVSNKHDYVLNLDDDEFIYSTKSINLSHYLLHNNNMCISNPVLFFGTTMSSNTGTTTIDFIHRERDVNPAHTNLDVDFASYMHPYKTIHVKKRTEKAIFKVSSDKGKLLSLLGNGIRHGALIHGYGLDCEKQHDIKVAHYTRSNNELQNRIVTFWKNVKGQRERFNNMKKIKKYVKERNRTEMIDTTIRDISVPQ